MTCKIASITGSPLTISRLAEIGIFPGQTIEVMRDGIWRIDGCFTVGLRMTDVEIVLE